MPDQAPCDNKFSRAMMYTLISTFAIISPKKQVVKRRKIKTDSGSDGGENHACTLDKNCKKNQKHLFVARYSVSAAKAKYVRSYLYLWSSEVKCMYSTTKAKLNSFLTNW